MLERMEMSEKEIRRLDVLLRISERAESQVMAAQALGLSVRPVRRLQRRYAESGAAGLISQRRGRPSNRRLDESVSGL